MLNTLRVLTTVNFSAGENMFADSGFTHLTALIRALVEADAALHFYVLVPEQHLATWQVAMPKTRVTLLSLPMERRLHGGDFQFEPRSLFSAIDLKSFEFDLLFLNQLETIPAYMNFFNRLTFHNLPAIGYMHWFDTRRPSTPRQHCHEPAILSALAGMSSSTVVGCNSRHAKRRVLNAARRWYGDRALEDLDQKLRVLPPIVTLPPLLDNAPVKRRKVQVLINHRMLKYTGVRPLLEHKLPDIWDARRDFRVHVTNPSRNRLPKRVTGASWLTVKTLSPGAYRHLLTKSDIVIAPHRATDWSMSTLEAICGGAVPLMNRESFFPEMLEPVLAEIPAALAQHARDRWFYFRQQFRAQFEAILDNLDEERAVARTVMLAARRVYAPEKLAGEWLSLLRDVAHTTPALSQQNPSVLRLRRALEARGEMTREEMLALMRWRPQTRTVAWTSVRRALFAFSEDDALQSRVRYLWTAGKLPASVQDDATQAEPAGPVPPLVITNSADMGVSSAVALRDEADGIGCDGRPGMVS